MSSGSGLLPRRPTAAPRLDLVRKSTSGSPRTPSIAEEFENLRDLVRLKERQGLTISLGLPALNEEETIGDDYPAGQARADGPLSVARRDGGDR